MKKIKLFLAIFLILLISSLSVFASEESSTIIQPRQSAHYGSSTVAADGTKVFYLSGGYFSLLSGYTSSFTYSLEKSSTIEIGFHNVNTGINYVIYYGTSSSGTKYYTPSSTTTGYYYIKNFSSGTILINSVTITS